MMNITDYLNRKHLSEKKWTAGISIQDNFVEVWVNETAGKEIEFCFYLYNVNNTIVGKSDWINRTDYRFVLEVEGTYFVKIFKKKGKYRDFVFTEYVDYYNKQTRDEFDRFCNQNMEYCYTSGLEPHYLYRMNDPYKDFAVIVNRQELNLSSAFLRKYKFQESKIKKGKFHIQILADEVREDGIIFSGLAKCGSCLINGEKDLKDKNQISDENIGNFTYVKMKNTVVEVCNDYFGTGKIYYFNNNINFIASNNYHLLLLILKDLKIATELNNEEIIALLCKSGQAFQQSITREREIKNAFMLPADEYIVVGARGILFKKKTIYSIFKTRKKRNIESGKKLLEKGREEIIDNVKIVLADKRYDKVVVDLTGGLDSRIVYGAVNNLGEYKNKVVIHADGRDAEINQENSDLFLAVNINCLNRYEYNTVFMNRIWYDIDQAENEMISQAVLSGYYYPYSYKNMIITRADEIPAIELTGFYGEICCRPYYSRKLLKKEKISDLDMLLSALANRKGILSGYSYNILKSKLKDELLALPGNSWLEKWELHYLFYRNGLHCNTVWEYEKRTPQWGPLQSKALFKYKHLTYGEIDGIIEQLQIISSMDQRLLQIPFTDQQDEEERQRFAVDYISSKSPYGDAELFEQEKERWMRRRKERRLHSKDFSENAAEDYKELQKRGEEYDNQLSLRLNEMLHRLMRYNNGIYKELFGISIFWAVKQNRISKNEIKILYQKLLGIYFHICIFKM